MDRIEPHELQDTVGGYKGLKEFWMEDVGRQLAEWGTCCLPFSTVPGQKAGGKGVRGDIGDLAIPGSEPVGNNGMSQIREMFARSEEATRKVNRYFTELDLCRAYAPETTRFVDVLQVHGNAIDKDKNQRFSIEELKEFYNVQKKEQAKAKEPNYLLDLDSIDWAIKNWNKFGLKTGRPGGGETTLAAATQAMYSDMHDKVPKEEKKGMLTSKERAQLEKYFAAIQDLGKS